MLSDGRLAAGHGSRDVRVRTGCAARQTAARPVCVRRRQRISGIGETRLQQRKTVDDQTERRPTTVL